METMTDSTFDFGAKFNREMAMREGYTPTGRKLGVSIVKGTSLYKVVYVDDKPGPRELTDHGLDSMWTKPEMANEALQKYLKAFWDMSDSTVKKNERAPKSGAN